MDDSEKIPKQSSDSASNDAKRDGPEPDQSTKIPSTYVNTWARRSLQTCTTEQTYLRLEALICRTRHPRQKEKLEALQTVLLHLTAENASFLTPSTYPKPSKGYMLFNEAYSLYLAKLSSDLTKEVFRDHLLNAEHGLPVYIVQLPVYPFHRYIILQSKELDIIGILYTLIADQKPANLPLSPDIVDKIIKSMDTEYDKACARLLFADGKTRSELTDYPMDIDTISKRRETIIKAAEEYEHTKTAAADIVNVRLREKHERIDNLIHEKQKILDERQLPLPVMKDTEAEVELLKIRLEEVANLQNPGNVREEQKKKQCIRRTAQQLAEGQRIRRRKLGAGAPLKLDEEDEYWIAKCIEEKASYHGRRHETTMFTNRRVKLRDFLGIANHRMGLVNKPFIRSAYTIWNRSKPRNSRSIQAKNHKGHGLFCTAKPPKAEDKDNESTHYQRAHVKNVYMVLSKDPESSKLSLLMSKDDKAQLRPGTSEGCEKTRNVNIITLSGEGARHLPKYDWPETKVYITPSAHRIFTKKLVQIGDEIKLVMENDNHFVFVRPKAIIDSSGATWASETVQLILENPEVFEVPHDQGSVQWSAPSKAYARGLQFGCFQYSDMTEKEDTSRITEETGCSYRLYEKKRIDHLLHWMDKLKPTEMIEMNDLCRHAFQLKRKAELLQQALADPSRKVMPSLFSSVKSLCDRVIYTVQCLDLPMIRPRLADMTDAGPGVGVSNWEVRFRDAELNRLLGTDYKIRVHRARWDSGQNEAERTNSAIGDAVVDGSTIPWEQEKRFDGMTVEEIKKLNLKQYDRYENERMERNAWHVAREIAFRIDGAPVLSEYIHAKASSHLEDHFFFTKEEFKVFHSTSNTARQQKLPGAAYFRKILDYIDQHYKRGELFMEYLKGDCEQSTGELCSYCTTTTWYGPRMERIPQPKPDYRQLPKFHYLTALETPIADESGRSREVDDYNPRAQIKKGFEHGSLSLEDPHSIEKFSDDFIVPPALIENYITHLQHLQLMKEIRTNERKAQANDAIEKQYSDYDWDKLVTEGRIGKLRVSELEKYLTHHKLPTTGLKEDKVRTIVAHISTDFLKSMTMVVDPDDDEEFDEQEYEEWEIMSSDAESDEISCTDESVMVSQEFTNVSSTRSGRQVKKTHLMDCFRYN